MNVLGLSRAVLSRRDSYYLLSLLAPFVAYELSLKAASVLWLPGERGFASILELMLSDVFFVLGYALLMIVLFAATTPGRPLRWAVVFLFHAVTMLVVTVTTFAYEYFRQTGAALDYGAVIERVAGYDALTAVLGQGDPPLGAWRLLLAALLYVALGPLVVTRLVERRRRQSGRSPDRTSLRVSSAVSLGLLLLAIGLGSLALLVGPESTDAEAPIVREPFVNVVLTGVQGGSTGEAGTEKTTAERDDPDADLAAERPDPANARLAQTPQTEKRNVVLIRLESARAQSVTPYNEDLKTMPFLDALAEESLVAERTHVTVPRSSKGSTAVNCGVEPALYAGPEYEPGNLSAPCLAGLLKEQGYRTAYFQSLWDTGDDSSLAANIGYEEFYPSQSMNTDGFQITNTFGYEDDVMLEPSEQWLKAYGNDGPFLAEYFTSGAHYGYDCVPNRYGYEKFSDDEQLDRYLNCLRMLDFFLQNLFDQYKRLGLYEDTIFVLYGDHGEGFNEHGRKMHGDTIWEEGVSVPLIIHDPKRFRNGERAEGISSQIDILPTVVEMLGYEVEGGEYSGYSLLRPLPEDRTVMSSCITNRRCMASVGGNEKYIYHYGDQPDEVFDLSKDPLEKNNIASEYSQEELDERREELFEWRTRVNAKYGRILASGNPVLGEE